MADTSGINFTTYQQPNSDFNILSGSVNFTGLGSGTDFNKVVEQLVQIESLQKQRLEVWRQTWDAKINSMRALNQRMEAIEEAAGAMDTEDEFMARMANTSDYTAVTATADNSAETGAYSVEVGTSVKHILRSTGAADAGTTAYGGAGGTMIINIAGTDYNVAINNTDTLNQIASAINTAVGSTVATVESDGTSSRPYHLVIKSPTGGDAGRISVSQNPTDLSLGYQDVAMQSTGTFTPSVSVLGQFTGDSATASAYTYTFTVANSSNPSTIGTDSFDVNWTASAGGGSGTITVPADYVAGQSLEVENGIFIQLGAGTVSDGHNFTLRAMANDIDAAETDTWSGPAITTSGNYLGPVNKTYSFSVTTGGDIQSGGGADTVVLRWTDSTGRTGTVSLEDSDQAYEVDQGVKIQLAAGTLTGSDTFQVNVFATDQQMGQDKGLAQATRLVHAGFADTATTPVTNAAGAFTYTYAGETYSVSVAGGRTLSQLVTDINGDANNPGVTASIINDGQGLPDSYKLILTGQDVGAQNQITSINHTLDNFDTGGDVGGGFTRAQWATNAMVKVDGYPAETDIFLQRTSNQVSDVITGVTLSLHDAGSVVISVTNDTNAIYGKIESLINAVNYAQTYIRQETKYDPDGEKTGILIGNYSYYILKSRIDTSLNESVSGLVDGTDTYTHLAQVGIHTDPDAEGKWSIDSNTLRNALTNDPEAVANLFINNTTKGSTGVAKRVHSEMLALTDAESGTLNVLIDNYNDIIANIDKKIKSEEKRLELYRQRTSLKFARLETALGQLNSQAKALESAIGQLPKSGS